MGKPKDPKKVKPGVRGEKWRLSEGDDVIVLERQGKGFVRCFNSRGWIEIIHDSKFMERLA